MTDPVCQAGTPFAAAVDAVRAGRQDPDQAASGLIAQLTDPELLGLLDGDQPVGPGHARDDEALQRRADRGRPARPPGHPRDSLHRRAAGRGRPQLDLLPSGHRARRELGHRAGAAGRRGDRRGGRAQGANLFAGVCINVPPFPGWGRSQESYGEDPVSDGRHGCGAIAGRAAVGHDNGQALRLQLDGRGPLHRRRPGRRGRSPRGLPAALPDRRRVRGRRGHELVQLGQRGVGRAEPAPPDRDPARGVGIRGVRHDGLHLGAARPDRVRRRRPGPGNAVRPAAGEGPTEGSARWTAGAPGRSSGPPGA